MNMPSRPARGRPARHSPPTAPGYEYPSIEDRALKALADARKSVGVIRIPDPQGWANVPIVGTTWEMAHDIQEGDYGSAALNGLMLAAELSPAAPIARVARLARATKKMSRVRLLARDATVRNRVRKVENLGPDMVVHHVVPLKGGRLIPSASRDTEGLWRNHVANLKILPRDIHHKVHGTFGNRYTDPALKLWHGTNDLHKAGAAATVGVTADSVQNSVRPGRKAREHALSRPVLDPNRPIEVRRTEQGFIISNKRR